eukprot:GEMP01026295.1.p1 GENE.GEMP01026295.1~~GEMP01026295.1.p1  ORF type:complete len:326 (+),score=74.70 GEMP01026295.1:257-1234(+)
MAAVVRRTVAFADGTKYLFCPLDGSKARVENMLAFLNERSPPQVFVEVCTERLERGLKTNSTHLDIISKMQGGLLQHELQALREWSLLPMDRDIRITQNRLARTLVFSPLKLWRFFAHSMEATPLLPGEDPSKPLSPAVWAILRSERHRCMAANLLCAESQQEIIVVCRDQTVDAVAELVLHPAVDGDAQLRAAQESPSAMWGILLTATYFVLPAYLCIYASFNASQYMVGELTSLITRYKSHVIGGDPNAVEEDAESVNTLCTQQVSPHASEVCATLRTDISTGNAPRAEGTKPTVTTEESSVPAEVTEPRTVASAKSGDACPA